MFSISASASAAWSGTDFTSAGTSRSPAFCAARQRRSPATISKRPPSTGRTRIGCMIPCSRIESASSASDASSIFVRGW